jgi:hypothetical protein
MRPRRLHRLARVLGKRATLGAMSTIACVATLAACGGKDEEDTIPQDQGDQIVALLDQLDQRVDDGNCVAAQATALEIVRRVEALPKEVDGELRETLVTASDNLVSQSRDPDQCQEAEEPLEEEPSGATGEGGVVP